MPGTRRDVTTARRTAVVACGRRRFYYFPFASRVNSIRVRWFFLYECVFFYCLLSCCSERLKRNFFTRADGLESRNTIEQTQRCALAMRGPTVVMCVSFQNVSNLSHRGETEAVNSGSGPPLDREQKR